MTLSGTTRTGALDLTLAVPQDAKAIAQSLQALRNDRGVLWAETPRIASTAPKAALVQPPAASEAGQRLMVRLKDGANPDWGALLRRLGSPHRDGTYRRTADRQRVGDERAFAAIGSAAGADGAVAASRMARCSTPTR